MSCIDTVVAQAVGCWPTGNCPLSSDPFAGFAKCRHTYFHKWATFQTGSYSGSTCRGSRFTSMDSGATVTDGLTGLVWEVKDGTVGGSANPSDPENVNDKTGTFYVRAVRGGL